jgi:ferredoxin
MSSPRFLASADVARLAASLIDSGVRVVGPSVVGGRSEYRRIERPEQLDFAAPMPALSLKSLFLPASETLFTWRRRHNDVELVDAPPASVQTVVLGARPCDAAGIEVLDKVMGWDYRDEPWFERRRATTIVALACASKGPDCFCETVGLGPASPKGADLLLTPVDGGFLTEALTEKGTALVERCAACFSARPAVRLRPATADPRSARTDGARAEGEAGRPEDLASVQAWLASHFDDPLWARLGLRCHGCGACASVCPTCHCFDIVDESDGLLEGTRRRNWDACQASKFTVHASGHNPRGDQGARYRQRVLHKFSIYPQRFGEVLCTGCGRCAATCPAGQNMAEILAEVALLAREG